MMQTSGFVTPSVVDWIEIDQKTYDAWSRVRQLAYCAARDEASALREPEHAEWYAQRAAMYRRMIDGL